MKKKWSDIERNDIIIEIAKLNYEEKKPQIEIAKQLNISQTEVSRLLKEARDNDMINLFISPRFQTDLPKKLINKYPFLKDAKIAITKCTAGFNDVFKPLGYESAKYLVENVRHTSQIGFSCGRTIAALIKNIDKVVKDLEIPPPEKCRLYALVNPCIKEIVYQTPASLIASAVSKLPKSIGFGYQFPEPKQGLEDYSSVDFFKKHPDIKNLINDMEKLEYYFIGIGGIEGIEENITKQNYGMGYHFNTQIEELNLAGKLNELGAIGECNYQPFDKDGKFLLENSKNKELKPLKDRIIYLPLSKIQERAKFESCRVVLIGGGVDKYEAIRAALKAKLCNCLITDCYTARSLICD